MGLGLTALLASFMSGMAGNVTAFNTVFTYDIYQSYIHPGASDRHYLWVGRIATVGGIALSIAAAYAATRFNNIMDMLQLVFGFVNAPLFATFLLGMFWKRATGQRSVLWLAGRHAGRCDSSRHHFAAGGHVGLQRRLADRRPVDRAYVYHSDMADNFWMAIWAWSVCFVATIVVSLMTKPRDERELVGLVYSLTEKPKDEGGAWYNRPMTLGVIVLLMTVALNFFFR